MNKERDLLPWILGALSIAMVAVAIALASTSRAVAPVLQPPVAAVQATSPGVSLPSPAPATASAALPEPAPAPPAAPAPAAAQVQAQAAETPPVESGQIWECTTNGLKTFSNNPCGAKSSLRELSPINTMSPTPVIHYAGNSVRDPQYAPARQYDRNAPAPQYDQNAYADDVNSEPGASDSSGYSYPIVQGLAFAPRRRAEHPHHRDHAEQAPNHSGPGPSLRRN
jgi:hypothetical protein